MAQNVPHGKRQLPVVVDDKAARSPYRPFASIPRPDWRRDGWYDITYSQLAGATNAMSWWLDKHLGPSKCFDTFAYMGPNDLRYCFILLAAIKTKRQVLLADTSWARESYFALITETDCSTLVAAAGATSVFEDIKTSRPDLVMLTIPSFDECIEMGNTAIHYPYERTYEESEYDPILVLHSSGTTGLPKPMVQTTKMLGVYDAHLRCSKGLPRSENTTMDLFREKRILSWWPMCWIGGIIADVVSPIMADSILVLLPFDAPRPTSAGYLDEILQLVKVDAASLPPSAIKELCKDAAYLERLRELEFVSYAGAPLEREFGDLLTDHMIVHAAYGSIETGGLPTYVYKREPRDWMYYQFHPASGVRLEQQPLDPELYELVIDRKKELTDFQIIFDRYPDLEVWHVNDLFRQHPEREDMWLYVGRKDDFVKLANMSKFQSLEVEEIVERHPRVHRALLGGAAQDAPFLLIELKGISVGLEEQGLSGEEKARARDEIWLMVDKEVNGIVRDAIKIRKNMVVVLDRPLKQTGKGTLDRRGSFLEFKDETDKLYTRGDAQNE